MALTQLLAGPGIAEVDSPFTVKELVDLNAALEQTFGARRDEARAYVHYDELAELGLLVPILAGAMRNLLTAIVPDPVLYHCHVYEIAGNSTRSHIFGDSLGGWHKDPDSEFDGTIATHVSVFLYLSDVGPDDGAFEFCPHPPDRRLRSTTPAITMTGAANRCFAWNRSYFHRAAPNRGPHRRRLLKLSVQPNGYANRHMSTERFARVREIVPTGDPFLDVLVGRHLGGPAPITGPSHVAARPVAPTGELGIADSIILKTLARDKLRAARRWLKGSQAATIIPYD